MKKILIIAALVACGNLASAQISGGIKGGVNFANIDVDGDPDGKTGYHVGVFASFGAAGIFIQPELLYSAKGAEDFDLTYIEIPILLRKNFAKVLNIHLGPQFGILTKGEIDTGVGTVDVKDELKGSDLSAVFGAGVNLPGGLSAGGRYILGLSDIDDGFGTEIKNRTFQLYVGYKLFGN